MLGFIRPLSWERSNWRKGINNKSFCWLFELHYSSTFSDRKIISLMGNTELVLSTHQDVINPSSIEGMRSFLFFFLIVSFWLSFLSQNKHSLLWWYESQAILDSTIILVFQVYIEVEGFLAANNVFWVSGCMYFTIIFTPYVSWITDPFRASIFTVCVKRFIVQFLTHNDIVGVVRNGLISGV